MTSPDSNHIRVAILDLYEGAANQGMRCIRELLNQYAENEQLNLSFEEFDVRVKEQLPDLSFDFYISSGGPGSPIDSTGSSWENKYFDWIRAIENHNYTQEVKKHVLFICHSFQIACKYFGIGEVCKRKSTSFGVFPIHVMPDGITEEVFQGLQNPFYTVDSREYQVINPNFTRIEEMGAAILAIEKDRPHVPLPRAIMAMRFSEYFIGTQFHPEADAVGMSMYLQTEEKKKTVIDNHGEAKWKSMIDQLDDPEKIMYTYNHIIPNFLQIAIGEKVLA
jgi:homoserine O-succinyltransferase/O-acetyltransferase